MKDTEANILHVQDRLSLPSVHAQSVWTFTAKPEDAILLSEYAIYSISQMQTAIMEAYMPGNVQCVYNSIKGSATPEVGFADLISTAVPPWPGSKLPCMYLFNSASHVYKPKEGHCAMLCRSLPTFIPCISEHLLRRQATQGKRPQESSYEPRLLGLS